MDRRIRLLGVAAALLLSPASFVPAFAQNVGDPCTGTDRQYTVSGPGSSALVCNGSTLELLGKDLSNPVRKGIGTATPAATLDVAGEAKIGNTNLTCSATTEGAMRYNSTSKEMEYCNGTAWASLSPAAGGGGLKVYNSDGVTELGNLVGTRGAVGNNTCVGLNYADPITGTVTELSSEDCSIAIDNVVVWTGPNCTGTPYAGVTGGTVGYCCAGSGTCTANKCKISSSGSLSFSSQSQRDIYGVCSSYTSVKTRYPLIAALCGDGECVVK